MTAAADDVNTKSSPFKTERLQLAASQTIYQGTFVCRNAAGRGVPGADTAGLTLAGISEGSPESGLSTAVSAAADTIYVRLQRKGSYKMVAAGLTDADIGKKCYIADDQTVQLVPTNVFAGYIVGIASATEPWVEIDDATQIDADDADEMNIEFVGVAANDVIVAGTGVALDADGYLTPMDDANAVSFWGYSLEGADNTGGADGDIDCAVQRRGNIAFTGVGLAATDVGKEVWQNTDAVTVTTTPGALLVGVIGAVSAATTPTVQIRPMPIVGQRSDRRFMIPFVRVAAVGHAKINAMSDLQQDRQYCVISGQADSETAPGGVVVCTIELDDGATQFSLTITGAAIHGENLTAALTAMLATDTDVTMIDDDAAGATAVVKGHFVCEYL